MGARNLTNSRLQATPCVSCLSSCLSVEASAKGKRFCGLPAGLSPAARRDGGRRPFQSSNLPWVRPVFAEIGRGVSSSRLCGAVEADSSRKGGRGRWPEPIVRAESLGSTLHLADVVARAYASSCHAPVSPACRPRCRILAFVPRTAGNGGDPEERLPSFPDRGLLAAYRAEGDRDRAAMHTSQSRRPYRATRPPTLD